MTSSQGVGIKKGRGVLRWVTGLARQAIGRATRVSQLWCLVENHRARGLYEHLGWRPTGREQTAVWPPYPREMEYAR